MTDLLVAGYGIKILGRERDLPILTDGARDDRTFSGGMRDKNISEGAGFAHFDRHDA